MHSDTDIVGECLGNFGGSESKVIDVHGSDRDASW